MLANSMVTRHSNARREMLTRCKGIHEVQLDQMEVQAQVTRHVESSNSSSKADEDSSSFVRLWSFSLSDLPPFVAEL